MGVTNSASSMSNRQLWSWLEPHHLLPVCLLVILSIQSRSNSPECAPQTLRLCRSTHNHSNLNHYLWLHLLWTIARRWDCERICRLSLIRWVSSERQTLKGKEIEEGWQPPHELNLSSVKTRRIYPGHLLANWADAFNGFTYRVLISNACAMFY